MNVLRNAVRQAAPVAKRVQQRMMSGGSQAEEFAAAQQYKQISKGMVAGVGVLLCINGVIQATNEHHHHVHPKLSYLQIRTKPFPWACDCGPFEGECWDKCEAAKNASH
jgi:hypothetical protein